MSRNLMNLLKVAIAIFFFTLSQMAMASDAKQLFDALVEEATKRGNELKYEKVEEKGDIFVIHGLDFKNPAKKQAVFIAESELHNFDFLGGVQFTYDKLLSKDIRINIETRLGQPFEIKVEQMETSPYVQIEQDGNPAGQLDQAVLTGISFGIDDGKTEASFSFPRLLVKNVVRSLDAASTTEAIILEAGTGTIGSAGKDREMAFNFDGFTINNMIEYNEGHAEIENLDIKPIRVVSTDKRNPFEMNFEGARIKNYFLPDLSKDTSQFFGDKELSMEILPLTLISNGNEIMGWQAGYGKGIVSEDGNTQEVFSGITGMYVDFTKFDLKPQQKAQLQQMFALGYEKPVFDFILNFSWNKETGMLDFSKYALKIRDAGAVELAFRLGGYTEQIARSLTQAATELNAQPTQEERNAAVANLLPLLAPLTIERVSISVADDSLLNKLVAVQSQKSGQDPDQLKAIAAPMVGILLNPIGVPALAQQASQAVTLFMAGNKTISISAEPETPPNMLEIIGLAQQYQAKTLSPAELIERLNVTVDAQ